MKGKKKQQQQQQKQRQRSQSTSDEGSSDDNSITRCICGEVRKYKLVFYILIKRKNENKIGKQNKTKQINR